MIEGNNKFEVYIKNNRALKLGIGCSVMLGSETNYASGIGVAILGGVNNTAGGGAQAIIVGGKYNVYSIGYTWGECKLRR